MKRDWRTWHMLVLFALGSVIEWAGERLKKKWFPPDDDDEDDDDDDHHKRASRRRSRS